MGNLEDKLLIQTVQLTSASPNVAIINPTTIALGRNSNYTLFQRGYIRCDLSQINGDLLKEAILQIPVINCNPEEMQFLLFWINSTFANLTSIKWSNIGAFQTISTIGSAKTYTNNYILVDITNSINTAISQNYSIFEMLLVGNEQFASQILFRNELVDDAGISVKVILYNQNESFYEKTITVNQSGQTAYTSNIDYSIFSICTVFVKNNGGATCTATLENSGNGVNFVTGSETVTIAPGATQIVIPYYFSKYMRIKYTTSASSINTSAIIQGNLNEQLI